LDADLVEVAERHRDALVTRLVAHQKCSEGVLMGLPPFFTTVRRGAWHGGSSDTRWQSLGRSRTTRRSVSTRASTASSWFRSSSVSGVPRGQGA
jgi:hypothetical protein